MCPRSHNRTLFYKYMSPSTCKAVLETNKIRWSSPVLFNDPFDCACSFNYGFELTEARAPFIAELERIVFGRKEVVGDLDNDLFKHLMLLRNHRNSVVRREFRNDMNTAFDTIVGNIKSLSDKFSSAWDMFMRNQRILCLSETHDSIPMWSHYAKDHSGAVLCLRWVSELDNALGAATKVKYSGRMPAIIQTVEEFIKHYTGQKYISHDDIFLRFTCTKSTHWKYEKEWRIINPLPQGDKPYEDVTLHPKEIAAVYFGCKAEGSFVQSMTKLLEGNLGHVEVYQGTKDRFKYGLSFTKLK